VVPRPGRACRDRPYQPLAAALQAGGFGQVDWVAALTHTQHHYLQIIESLKPQGAMVAIDDMMGLDLMALKNKSIAMHWEMMFTRSMFQTLDMGKQGKLLAEVAQLVDAGRIRSTVNTNFGSINAVNLRLAHALIESDKARGKVVLEGF
jgi:NADPH:quinone reductase-like Zn-dependent oxidoreductase